MLVRKPFVALALLAITACAAIPTKPRIAADGFGHVWEITSVEAKVDDKGRLYEAEVHSRPFQPYLLPETRRPKLIAMFGGYELRKLMCLYGVNKPKDLIGVQYTSRFHEVVVDALNLGAFKDLHELTAEADTLPGADCSRFKVWGDYKESD